LNHSSVAWLNPLDYEAPPVAGTGGTAALGVSGCDAHYGKRQVLRDVSCEFLPQQVTAIMGPSGCGKSTFIKALNRTLELTPGARISRGSVLFRGENIYHHAANPADIRKRIGIIQQRAVIFPMSILENVLFGARFHQLVPGPELEDYARVQLERVGLWSEVRDRLHASAANLSGGQQQRLCLARTLANRPEVILMDEPCSALDPAATRRIEELIAELEKDFTIIIVTHNMSQARRVSRQAMFFYEGRLVEAGPTAQLFENPGEALTREFVSGQIG
jgi:phosphate transport system ATP-binding protein